MKSSITIGLILMSLLLVLSLGAVIAEVSNDKVDMASSTSADNATGNATNATSINITNDTLPLNSSENVTNPFIGTKGCT